MRRREILGYGALGGATFFLEAGTTSAQTAARTIELSIEPTDVELIDGRMAYMLLFFGLGASGEASGTLPRPVLRVREGERLRLRVANNAPGSHGFAITGVPAATINAIPPGGVREVEFLAPKGGSYIYHDPTNAPAHRLLGLHGALVSEPANGLTRAGSQTPFSKADHNSAIEALFDACSPASTRYPGDPWIPGRDKIWVFSSVDPALHERAARGLPIIGADVQRTYRARYFMINGLSGFDASEEATIKPKGYVGQPLLIRTFGCGAPTHSPHIHGNHVVECSFSAPDGAVALRDNLFERDSWTLRPMDRKDVLLPFERPNDIPDKAWPPRQEPFPLRYAMHCHTEMSQTARGGSYPQGLTTHWELLGPVKPAA